jgi:hypothetical protein
MISLLEFKKALGKKAKELSDQQILDLRDRQDQMAEVFFSMWTNQLKKK